MLLEKAPSWTDLYYQMVENYFWSPQLIGRSTLIQCAADPFEPVRHPSLFLSLVLHAETEILNASLVKCYFAADPNCNDTSGRSSP